MNLLELMYKCEYDLIHLHPTPEEIDGFIRTHNDEYGLFTYSNYRGGNGYFISFHDNHNKHKHYHIDVGYVNFDAKYNNVTHLMLDKYNAPEFISFIKEQREKL